MTTMTIIRFVIAAGLLGFCSGINSFRTCDSAQVVFEGFDLSNNSKVAWREKNAFFDAADCNGDKVVSMDEFSCMWKRSGVDLRPFFKTTDKNGDGYMSDTEYFAMLPTFDRDGNGRIFREEFIKSWIEMLIEFDVPEQSIEPDPFDEYDYPTGE